MQLTDSIWHRFLRRPYTLATQDTGSGQPVVLLHGLAASGKVWKPLVRLLPGRRLIVPDLLGFGASPKPSWNQYDAQQHARMVAATLKKHGVTTGTTVVGHSMGCLVAVQLAMRYPRLVDRLVLYEPPLFADDPQYRRHAKYRSRYFAFFGYIVAHPKWAFTQTPLLRMAKKLAGIGVDQATWLPFERSLKHTIMQQQTLDDLRRSTIPTDIIHGRLDFVVLRASMKQMFAANPNITLHMVTDMHGVSARSARYIARLVG